MLDQLRSCLDADHLGGAGVEGGHRPATVVAGDVEDPGPSKRSRFSLTMASWRRLRRQRDDEVSLLS
jgi:hypothetical protein